LKRKKIVVFLLAGILVLMAIGITLPFFSTDFACLSCGCDSEPQCPTSLPSAELAVCQASITQTHQAINTQALSAAQTLVAQTVISAALSATPTPTASATPTARPTRTPIPTSTVWRVEPVATSVTMPYKYLDIYGVDDLPSFDVGSRWKTHSFDENGDGEPDLFLYTDLTVEQEQNWRQSLLEFLIKRGDVSQIDIDNNAFAVLDALDIDLDRDGSRETAFAYVFGPIPHVYSVVGVAAMRDGKILDSTPLDWQGENVEAMRLIGVPISSSQNAVLAHLTTVTSGSGVYPHIYRRLLVLENDKLRIAWDWEYFGGGRAGASFQEYHNETIRFLNLTSHTEKNLLLSRKTEKFSSPFDNPANYLNYALELPGELVFSWVNGKYQLTHFYNGDSFVPIRPLYFLTHAPKMNTPLLMDGDRNDWYQVEYQDALRGFGVENYSRSPGLRSFRMAWDDNWLYFQLETDPYSLIHLAFDSDLQGDFDSHILNQDDSVFQINLIPPSGGYAPQCKLYESAMIYPRKETISAQSVDTGAFEGVCRLEGKIPLSLLGLASPLVVKTGYALQWQDTTPSIYLPYSFTQYLPSSGQVIGFVAFSENKPMEKLYSLRELIHPNLQDPTTWGTLIFISDR